MQVAPITFKTFRTLFCQKDVSTIAGITRLARGFSRRHSLPSKTVVAFMITTMAFILAFPTIASAMTGYSSNVEAFVEDERSTNYVPFNNLRRLYYTIHDGSRLMMSENLQIMTSYGEGRVEQA